MISKLAKLLERKPFLYNTKAYGLTSAYYAHFITIFRALHAKEGLVLDPATRKPVMTSAKTGFIGMEGREAILE